METVENKLAELWDTFGKSYNERQMAIYARWANGCESNILIRAINQIMEGAQRFPSLGELKNVYNSLRPKRNSSISSDPENVCYWCQDTGAVPVIETSGERGYYMIMFGCKCSFKMRIPGFHYKYPEGQYMDRVKQLNEFSYPQAIQIVLRELTTKKKVVV
jgi:hypothetical protein